MFTLPSSPPATARAPARCSGSQLWTPKNPPLTEDGQVDFSQDFFGKPANLTVSGQLNAENFAMAFGDVYLRSHLPG